MSSNDSEIVVYWAVYAKEYDWALQRLLVSNPTPLAKDAMGMNIFEKVEGDNTPPRSKVLLKCPAHVDTKTNIVMPSWPFSGHFEFDDEGQIIGQPENLNFVWVGNPHYTEQQKKERNTTNRPFEQNHPGANRFSISFNQSLIYFCEEELIMEIMPPYLHNAETSSYGNVITGEFDISKWFRPVWPEYLLWENVKKFSCKEGEPSMYIKFQTNKKIVFKEFRSTNIIHSIAQACISLSSVIRGRNEGLEGRYNRFVTRSLKSAVANEIKKNLL